MPTRRKFSYSAIAVAATTLIAIVAASLVGDVIVAADDPLSASGDAPLRVVWLLSLACFCAESALAACGWAARSIRLCDAFARPSAPAEASTRRAVGIESTVVGWPPNEHEESTEWDPHTSSSDEAPDETTTAAAARDGEESHSEEEEAHTSVLPMVRQDDDGFFDTEADYVASLRFGAFESDDDDQQALLRVGGAAAPDDDDEWARAAAAADREREEELRESLGLPPPAAVARDDAAEAVLPPRTQTQRRRSSAAPSLRSAALAPPSEAALLGGAALLEGLRVAGVAAACYWGAPRLITVALYALQPLFVTMCGPLAMPWLRRGGAAASWQRVVALGLFTLCVSAAVVLEIDEGAKGRAIVNLDPVALLVRRTSEQRRSQRDAALSSLALLLATTANALRVVLEERVAKEMRAGTFRIIGARAPTLAALSAVVIGRSGCGFGGGASLSTFALFGALAALASLGAVELGAQLDAVYRVLTATGATLVVVLVRRVREDARFDPRVLLAVAATALLAAFYHAGRIPSRALRRWLRRVGRKVLLAVPPRLHPCCPTAAAAQKELAGIDAVKRMLAILSGGGGASGAGADARDGRG